MPRYFASCIYLSVLTSLCLGLAACSSPEDPAEAVGVVAQAVAPVTSCDLPAASVARVVLPAGVSVEAAGAVAYGTLKVSDRARIVAGSGLGLPVYNVGAAGAGGWISEVGVNGRVGAIQSVPNVFLRNNAVVQGGIQTEGAITTQGGEQVSGVQVQGTDLPDARELSWLPDFVEGPGTNVLLQNQTSATRGPGTYGNVQVHSGSTLTLSPGVYRMQALQLESQSTLQLSGNGYTVIYVSNGIIWRGNVQGHAGSSPAPNFLLVFGGSSFSALEKPFKGTLVAPQASVRLGVGGTPHSGAFFAKQIELDPDVQVTHVPFAHWDQVLHRQNLVRLTSNEPVCDGSACCPQGMDHAFLDDANNVLGIDFENLCVVAKAGDDKLSPIDLAGQGRVAVLAGSGNDLVQGSNQNDLLSGAEGDDTLLGGAGADELFGGPGDDYLCGGDGDDVIVGGPGNDTILGGNGNNTVIPGPGVDTVTLGSGDDTLYIYDLCEARSGETFNGGLGNDTLVSPVPFAELQALGITITGFETVRVEQNSCRSECVEKPDCSGNGFCVEGEAPGEVFCACWGGFYGDDCSEGSPVSCSESVSGVPESVVATIVPDNLTGLRWESGPLVPSSPPPMVANQSSVSCNGGVCTTILGLTGPTVPFRVNLTRVWEEDEDHPFDPFNSEDESVMHVWIDGHDLGNQSIDDCSGNCRSFEHAVDPSQEQVTVRLHFWEDDGGDNDHRFDRSFTVDNMTGALLAGDGLYQRTPGSNEWCAEGGGSWACWTVTVAGRPEYCFVWNAQYIDSALGEDYGAATSVNEARGFQRVPASFAFGRVTWKRGTSVYDSWDGYLDVDGCIPIAERPDPSNFDTQEVTGQPLTVISELTTQFCLDYNNTECASGAGVGTTIRHCNEPIPAPPVPVCRVGTVGANSTPGGATACTVSTENVNLTPADVPPGCEIVRPGSPRWEEAPEKIGRRKYLLYHVSHNIDTRVAATVSAMLAQEHRTRDMGLAKVAGSASGPTTDFEVFTNAGGNSRNSKGEIIVESCKNQDTLGGPHGLFIWQQQVECSNHGCDEDDPDLMDDISESYLKYVIGHELGHVIQDMTGGNPRPRRPYKKIGTSKSLTDCQHVVSGNSVHCLQSLHISPDVQGEGFAHFFASKIWNDPTQLDCSFSYYKEVLTETHCIPGAAGCDTFAGYRRNLTPVPVSCTEPRLWRNHYGVADTEAAEHAGGGWGGTEWDWMTFYWNLNRTGLWPLSSVIVDADGDGKPDTIDSIEALYKAACGLSGCDGQPYDDFDFVELRDAMNPFDPRRDFLIEEGRLHGVDDNLDPIP